MRKIKIAIAMAFIITLVAALASQAVGYPPFMGKARKYGAKDCTFCHIDPAGGPPWNERGEWLIQEKAKRGADAVDVDWLAEYKPAGGKKNSAQPPAKTPDKNSAEKVDAKTGKTFDEQELLKLEREWLDAYAKRDGAAMERIEADDFMITYPNGQVRMKADEINDLKRPAPSSMPAFSTEETKVRVYGDTAVLTGTFVQKGTYADGANKGQEYTIKERYTDVYVRRNGRWQVVASHLTNIGPPPAPQQAPQQPPPAQSPSQPAATKIDPKVFDQYLGQYETPFGPLNITREGDRLFGQPEGDTKEELIPESETVFNVPGVGAKVTFVKDATGKVTHLVLNIQGQEVQAKKVK